MGYLTSLLISDAWVEYGKGLLVSGVGIAIAIHLWRGAEEYRYIFPEMMMDIRWDAIKWGALSLAAAVMYTAAKMIGWEELFRFFGLR
jgi:hypothetical protein